MELSVNQILTVLFPVLFFIGFCGWFFRCLSNRDSHDYKRSVREQENILDVDNTPLLDLARFYRGELRGEDVAPLLVSWADQGFIQLRFFARNAGQTDISLKKLKDLPEAAGKLEQAIFKCLFNKTGGKILNNMKLNDGIDPDKLARYEEDSVVTKLSVLGNELSRRFSLLFHEIDEAQVKKFNQQQSKAIYSRFSFLELFICAASLFMLAGSFSFFIDGQKLYSGEFYAYAGLWLLLTGVYFGALFKLGSQFCAGNFLGYLGVGFLVYLAMSGIQGGYEGSGNIFFENSYRYFGFIFGSLLALIAPTAKAMTQYGRNLREFFRTRRHTLCKEVVEQDHFWRSLPELMLYECVEPVAKKLVLKTPDWYEGSAAGHNGLLDSAGFVHDLDCLARELHLLAMMKR